MVYFRLNNLFRVVCPFKYSAVSRYCCTNKSIKDSSKVNELILYGDEVSPPVRFVQMTASMLDINLNFHHIDLFKEENKSEFYTKINPLQKVPALKVGGDIICDSHAIGSYLCEMSGNSTLYPADLIRRAKINQIMFFNSNTLFPIDSYVFSEYFRGHYPVNISKLAEWYSALDHLEYHLSNHKWLASDKVSLGDLCCGTTVTSLALLVPPLDRHVKISKWIHNLEKLPCYEINKRGLQNLRGYMNLFK